MPVFCRSEQFQAKSCGFSGTRNCLFKTSKDVENIAWAMTNYVMQYTPSSDFFNFADDLLCIIDKYVFDK